MAAIPGRWVVVEGDAGVPSDASTTDHIRQAACQLVEQAASKEVAAQAPVAASLLLLLALQSLVVEGLDSADLPGVAWLLAVAFLSLSLFALRPRAPSVAGLERARLLLGLIVASALLAVVPSWLAPSPAAARLWLAPSALLALALSAVLAPHAVVSTLVTLVPLASGAAAGKTGAVWGMLASFTALALSARLREGWRARTLEALQQAERVDAMRAARDAALRNDSDKSRFLAIASHDLRQPVHALGLFAATLHKRLIDSPDEALARNLMRSVDALERSFNAMLDVSRLDGGAVRPRPQTFPLRDIFRRLHMQYGGQAELAGLALRFSPGGKSVTSDPQLLERIIGNLVQNGIRYTVSGGVVVVARNTRTHLNIEVWDTGCGIAEADLQRIFEEFFQIGRGERDRTQGLGMGLAIVKRLATLLGHRLEVASVPGRGTLFRLGVAVGSLGGLDEETAAADTQPMTPVVQTARMVLVVDDEEPIREGLRLLLQEWGYQAITAGDAAQAEQAVAALDGDVDLILSDLHLGQGPGGREVVAQVRRMCRRAVPAILVTGDTAGQALREVAGGTDPVLFKPVQPRHLLEALRSALEGPSSSPEPPQLEGDDRLSG